ncbi:MAG: alpha/beta hydrolase [Methyloglobulus sp.]|nr:alpha/beta hydrolase [Methyloglobulus sp.]
MKRLFRFNVMILPTAVLRLLTRLRPKSANTLNYLNWKIATSAHTESGAIDNQGAHIHYVVYGKGDPVLLLHGGLSNMHSWLAQIPWLVESGRQVILIDTRGHGKSTVGNAKLSYEVFLEDALHVLERLGIERTDVIGSSDGGIIALLMGLKAPQRVQRIVAISANYEPSGLTFDASSVQEVVPQSTFSKIKCWLRSHWPGSLANDPALVSAIYELWRTEPQLKPSDLRDISAATLVMTGEHDIIDPAHSKQMAQMLGQGRLEIIAGGGHATPITHSQEVNQLIAAFLEIKLPV